MLRPCTRSCVRLRLNAASQVSCTHTPSTLAFCVCLHAVYVFVCLSTCLTSGPHRPLSFILVNSAAKIALQIAEESHFPIFKPRVTSFGVCSICKNCQKVAHSYTHTHTHTYTGREGETDTFMHTFTHVRVKGPDVIQCACRLLGTYYWSLNVAVALSSYTFFIQSRSESPSIVCYVVTYSNVA